MYGQHCPRNSYSHYPRRSEEARARIDIGFCKTAVKYVAVDLKYPSVRVALARRTPQIRKYHNGLLKMLCQTGEAWNPIEILILLGQRPGAWDDPKGSEQVSGGLANYDTRCVLYDEPLHTGQLARAEPTLRLWRKAGAQTPVPGTARRIRAVIQYLGLHAALRAAGGRQTP